MRTGPQLDRQKLKSAILRIISVCPPDELGAVKLHKALYYSDMIEFVATGVPITGAEYRKRPYGPTCDAALSAIRELEIEGRVVTRETPYHGFIKKEYITVGEVSTKGLSPDELALIDEMARFVSKEHSARSISEVSHDISWHMVEMGSVIPYHLAFNLVPSVVSAETMNWARGAADEIERARPDQDALEFADFSAVRGSLLEARR